MRNTLKSVVGLFLILGMAFLGSLLLRILAVLLAALLDYLTLSAIANIVFWLGQVVVIGLVLWLAVKGPRGGAVAIAILLGFLLSLFVGGPM